jgi:hypothetical protein
VELRSADYTSSLVANPSQGSVIVVFAPGKENYFEPLFPDPQGGGNRYHRTLDPINKQSSVGT